MLNAFPVNILWQFNWIRCLDYRPALFLSMSFADVHTTVTRDINNLIQVTIKRYDRPNGEVAGGTMLRAVF